MKKSIKFWNKGFTLIELLATIVILSILAIIVTPIAIKYLNKAEEDVSKIQDGKIKEAAKLYFDDCVNGDGEEVADLETLHPSSNVCGEFANIIKYHSGDDTSNENYKNTCVTLEKLVELEYMKPVRIGGGLYSANINIASESRSDVSYEIMPNRCFGYMPGEVSSHIRYFEYESSEEDLGEDVEVEEENEEEKSTMDYDNIYNFRRTCTYSKTGFDDTNKTQDEIKAYCLSNGGQ